MSALRPGWLVQQLPRVLREDALLVRFVGALEAMAAEARAPLDELEQLVDVELAPAQFVRWLGSWTGVPVEEGLPERRQREVVRVAGQQFPWRGTRRGLRELLEAYTGSPVRVEDSGGVTALDDVRGLDTDHVVTIHVQGAGGIDQHHLLRLVEQEVPADATVDLRVEDEVVEAEAQPGQLTDDADGDTARPPADDPGPMAPRVTPRPVPPTEPDETTVVPPPPPAEEAPTAAQQPATREPAPESQTLPSDPAPPDEPRDTPPPPPAG